MSLWSAIRQRLREALRPSEVDAELDEELRHHEALETARQMSGGTSSTEALRRARLRAGGIEQAKEVVREGRTGRFLVDTWSDLRYGARGLRRNPGFALAVVLSLALGTGGTTAIFSVVNAVLVRPLAYGNAAELYDVRVYWGDFDARLSAADMNGLRDAAGAIPGILGVSSFFYPTDGFTWLTRSGPEVLRGAAVLRDLPDVLGVKLVSGAGFSETRDAREVLIAESLWRERFGGSPEAIGTVMDLSGESFVIVGVMPAGFNVPGQRDGVVWTRAELPEATRRGPYYLRTVARIAGDTRAETVAARMTAAVTPVLRERMGVDEEWRYQLRALKEELTGPVRPTLVLLSIAVALVLLIAMLNVANLLLARGTVRERELAVRASLGAGRSRLARQLLAESALLGVLGGVLGLLLAQTALALISGLAASVVPRMDEVRMNTAVVGFAVLSGLLAGMGAGVMPALRLDWRRLNPSLREGGRGASEARRHRRLRRALVVAEVALSLAVLSAAGLLMKSLLRLERQHPGFEAAGVLSFRLATTFESDEEDRMGAFLAELDARLRAIPGTREVAFAAALPPDRLVFTNNYTLESDVAARRQSGVAEWVTVNTTYFATLGIRVVQGRVFQDGDRAGAPLATIVNEAFVRRHFPAGDALGKRFKGGDWDSNGDWMTIVGVVADVPYGQGVWGGAEPTVHVAYAQNLWQSSPYVLLKTDGDAGRQLPAARDVVRAIDARLPLRDVATMEQRLHDSAAAARFRGLLFALLASLALALAITGIYGVMAYHVNQRRRETAIRRALGADSSTVVGSVVRSGLALTAIGIAFGAAGATAMARGLTGMLFQVDPLDLRVLALSAAVLATAALTACALPAWRAARVNPLSVMRDE
jgi:predicted permease